MKLLPILSEIRTKTNPKIPKGWTKYKDVSFWNEEPGVYGGEVVAVYDAPMEGWDEEHTDGVMIIKFPNNTYAVNGWVAFGGFDETEKDGPFLTFNEAFHRAVEIMNEFKEGWDNDEDY